MKKGYEKIDPVNTFKEAEQILKKMGITMGKSFDYQRQRKNCVKL